MAVRDSAEPLVKITTRIYLRDLRTLQERFPGMGYQKAMRDIIAAHLSGDAPKREMLLPEIDLDIEELEDLGLNLEDFEIEEIK